MHYTIMFTINVPISDFTVPGTGTEDSMLCPSVKVSRHFLSVPRYFGTIILLIFRTKKTHFSIFSVFLQPFLDSCHCYGELLSLYALLEH